MAIFSGRKNDSKPAKRVESAAGIPADGAGGGDFAVTGEHWQRQVAIAAYQRWLARGGFDGDDQSDWYAAEAELKGKGKPAAPPSRS
ncbi:MAG TPA: DUF2934 domain-containing protein [Usitatibacter sp.]|jgi:hypothetical protein|nr:DUF2934 domain-containing protein [Usitatibacter sp.]